MKHRAILLPVIISLAAFACSEDDPKESDISVDSDPDPSGLRNECINDAFAEYLEDLSECSPLESDYTPGDPNGDNWAECISDDNTYHRIEESVSSIARVEAYDAMGDLLWNADTVPSAQDFVDAKEVLETEEGLGSRLDRRFDVHYDPPANGAACDEEGVSEANPDYCVGPGRLRPLINDAFADAAAGNNPIANAEIIHAALQWFMYVSAIKESTTCAENAKDCDSAWAYYTGGTDRDAPFGLAAEIANVSLGTHNRAYDGILAVRCKRDAVSVETAVDLDLLDQAIRQYDTALLHGMSILVRQRFVALGECADADEKVATQEALKVLVPLLNLETSTRNADAANVLMTEVGRDVDKVNTEAAVAAIDSVYLCP